MNGSIHLGRVKGIAINVHYTWFIVFALVVFTLAVFYFPTQYPGWGTLTYWWVAGITAFLFFSSVVAHELAHSLVAIDKGIPVESITLFIFGGVSQIKKEADKPSTEFWVSVVGPLSSVALGVIFGLIWLATRTVSELFSAIALYLGAINILLAFFNLIPGFPLDGGRVFRSILWGITHNFQRATRIAVVTGQIVAYGFILLGIGLIFFTGNLLGGIWLSFIGWFLANAATSSYRQAAVQDVLRSVHVQDLMTRDFDTAEPDATLQHVVDEHVLRRNVRTLPVVDDGLLVGLITLNDIKNVPRDLWPTRLVINTMVPRARLALVRPDDDMTYVLRALDEHDINQLPVVDDGHVVGLVMRSSVIRFLQIRRELGLDWEQKQAA
ncbi:MAG: site-2 protease family protein [Chloroflexi bacterium]|nr:site-2 protease family protein [Chloroflexota bacterium]